MPGTDIQAAFFKNLKQKLPSNLSMVDEVADLLNVSTDSAYRRIRGEKPLTIDEIQVLALHYRISVDNLMNVEDGNFLFKGSMIDRQSFTFENFLQQIVLQLQFFEKAEQKEMFYMNKDIPIFHLFMFPELACFKCYFWSRYNLNYPQYSKGQFLISDFINIFDKLGSQISNLYLNIPSTEIWNLDCINTTIRQIDFYRETKLFQSSNDIITVYNCLEKLVDHIEEQAEIGRKYPYKETTQQAGVKYAVYINEYFLGDNAVAAIVDGQKMVFINHSVINYIMTTNKKFTDYFFETIYLFLKRSTLISEVGEKDRQLFFNKMRERIYEKKKLVV